MTFLKPRAVFLFTTAGLLSVVFSNSIIKKEKKAVSYLREREWIQNFHLHARHNFLMHNVTVVE